MLLVVVWPGCVRSSDQVAADVSGWDLSLQTLRTDYRWGEPIAALVVLRNDAPVARMIPDLLSPEYGFLSVWLAGPGPASVTARPVRPGVLREGRGHRPVELAPGTSVSTPVWLHLDRDGWTLRDVGGYRAWAEYAPQETLVRSAPLNIRVAPPSPEEELAARKLMEAAVAFSRLAGGTDQLNLERSLKAFLRDHAASPLAPYARLYLGLALASGGAGTACQEAVPLLKAAVTELNALNNPLFAAQAGAELRECGVE